jgi:hypothetical protein
MPALVGLLSAVQVAASPERPGVAVRLVAGDAGSEPSEYTTPADVALLPRQDA